MFILGVCDNISVLGVILFIRNLIKIICIITPILLLLFLTIDFFKAVIESDSDRMEKVKAIAIKRIVYALFVFLVPSIVNGAMSLLGDNTSFSSCYEAANSGNVQKLADEAKAKAEADRKETEEHRRQLEADSKLLAETKRQLAQNASSSSSSSSSNFAGNLYKNGQISGSSAIAETAKALAWPKKTSDKIKYHNYGNKKFKKWSELGTARPTDAFKTAIDKAYKKHWKWGPRSQIGASCDVFVGTVVKYSGYDSKFPHGGSEQNSYLPKSTKWKKVSKAMRGDVCINSGHVMIFLGKKTIADAGYDSKRFGMIRKGTCSGYTVYRAVK